MIDCQHFESIDITPWHSDVFDHPSYQSFCHLKNKDIYRCWCAQCDDYIPDYKNLSDYEIEREFRLVKEKLETDDRAQPISWSSVQKLIKRKECLIEEMAKRNMHIST